MTKAAEFMGVHKDVERAVSAICKTDGGDFEQQHAFPEARGENEEVGGNRARNAEGGLLQLAVQTADGTLIADTSPVRPRSIGLADVIDGARGLAVRPLNDVEDN